MRALDDPDVTVGERIAYHRRRRGLSQVVLAGLVGRTEEWLSQIERGSRDLDRLSVLIEVARALRVEPIQLLGKPFTSRPTSARRNQDPTLGTAPDHVPLIRQAMRRYDGFAPLMVEPPDEAPTLDDLRRRLARAFRCSQTERWSELGPMLPDLIADAYHLVQAAPSAAGRRDAYRAQSLAYRVTSGMLDRLGETDLPALAAERAAVAAAQADDLLYMAGAAWRWSVVLRHSGDLPGSYEVPMRAAEALERDLHAASPEHFSVYGALLLKGAVGAASLGDHRAVRDYLARAERAGDRIGDSNHFWFAFGPTNIAIHRVWLALELGDPLDALARADDVRDTALPPELAERRTSHLITVSWAHYLRRHDREALDLLLQAWQAAPEQLLFTRRVHSMVRGMLKRERRTTKHDLRTLAAHLDVIA